MHAPPEVKNIWKKRGPRGAEIEDAIFWKTARRRFFSLPFYGLRPVRMAVFSCHPSWPQAAPNEPHGLEGRGGSWGAKKSRFCD